MLVKEIFYSLQGEGTRAGHPSVFVRLALCNLKCSFCDTDFAHGEQRSLDEISFNIQTIAPQAGWIVWTGGEPTLQLTEDHVLYFHKLGYSQAIETNGMKPVPRGIDHVCVSPKKETTNDILARNFPVGVDELRYVIKAGDPLPTPLLFAEYCYLSPCFDGDNMNEANLNHAIKLCLENPTWKLSVQTHKLIHVR